ncbi:MAG: GNAT family N-acetyltransferase [Pseudomonadota bacterium]
MSAVSVRQLDVVSSREFAGLCELLIDCVASGASVSFMHPMTLTKAADFWREVAGGVSRRERILVVAEDAQGNIVGTAQAVWPSAENQPHRADIVKMLVLRSARGKGVGAAVLAAVEAAARAAGRTLLVLDTASAEAERLYERGGWQRVGTIPKYALMPDGPLCSTVFFYKDLATD